MLIATRPFGTGTKAGRYRLERIGSGGVPGSALDLTDPDKAILLAVIEPHGRLDSTGTALVDLDPTDEVTPAGTAYRVTVTAPGQLPATLVFTVPVVAVTAPVTVVKVLDHIVALPTDIPSAAADSIFVRKVTAGALAGAEAAGVVTVSVPVSQWGIYTSGVNAGLPYFNSAGVSAADAANLHVEADELHLTRLGA